MTYQELLSVIRSMDIGELYKEAIVDAINCIADNAYDRGYTDCREDRMSRHSFSDGYKVGFRDGVRCVHHQHNITDSYIDSVLFDA